MRGVARPKTSASAGKMVAAFTGRGAVIWKRNET
jgi:hypothetical protein